MRPSDTCSCDWTILLVWRSCSWLGVGTVGAGSHSDVIRYRRPKSPLRQFQKFRKGHTVNASSRNAVPSRQLLPSAAIAQQTDCARLTSLMISSARIVSAEQRDDFCEVKGIASPVPTSRIDFAVWLPPPERWSQRLHMVGNGTMASGWAMTMNFDKDCTYDMPEIECSGPVRDASIKGAIMIAEVTSGPGYLMCDPCEEDQGRGLGRDRPALIGGNAVELNVVFFPSSAILAGMHKWPAVFFARGLWDYAAALEGTVDSYSRAQHPREIVVVRAPHPYEVWPESERRRAQERMLAFARAVLQGKSRVEGGREWTNMKELAATSSDVWESSTKPTTAE